MDTQQGLIQIDRKLPFTEQHVKELEARALGLRHIRDDEDQRQAAEIIKKWLDPAIKGIDDAFGQVLKEQKEAKAAQDRAIKATNKSKETLRSPLVEARSRLKGMILDYSERRDEALGRLAAKDPSAVPALASSSSPRVNTRVTYDVKVIDASRVPREYMSPDVPAMKRIAKAMGPEIALVALGGPEAVQIIRRVS